MIDDRDCLTRSAMFSMFCRFQRPFSENLEYKLQGNFNTASPPSHSSDIPEVIQSAFYSPCFYFEWDDVAFRRRLYSIYYLRLAPVESILSSYAYVKWCSLFLAWVLLLRKRWTACTAFYLISSSHNPAMKFPWKCMRGNRELTVICWEDLLVGRMMFFFFHMTRSK